MRLLATLLALVLFAGGHPAAQEPRLAWLGTGTVTGVYYPVGVALCRLVNQHRREHGIRCAARPTEGSVANLGALRDGALDLAITQSDQQRDALRGVGAFADTGRFEDLRAVMSLHAEPLTIVARADAGIAELADLAGKRVSLGGTGSGTRAIAEALIGELGWSADTFGAVPEIAPAGQGDALCAGEIDAFFFAVGHPALAIQETTSDCPAVLIDATGPAVEALVAAEPAYRAATIPSGLYRGTPREVATFGVSATLATRADVADDLVYTLVRSIFEDVDTLRGLHPALQVLDAEAMAIAGLPAPLHPGAERYFRERGWLP